MAESQEKSATKTKTGPHPPANARVSKIDPTAPAGSENSLGEESIRDGRPATGDEVVEAIDEAGPEA
jgi:hypothetical protein